MDMFPCNNNKRVVRQMTAMPYPEDPDHDEDSGSTSRNLLGDEKLSHHRSNMDDGQLTSEFAASVLGDPLEDVFEEVFNNDNVPW